MGALIRRTTPIERCPPLQTNIWWPAPVDQRLNELRELLLRAGYEVSRSQLLAALVTSAPNRSRDLELLVRQYKEKTAGAVVLQAKGAIREQDRKPGRRTSRV
jgi:hypothetical protein